VGDEMPVVPKSSSKNMGDLSELWRGIAIQRICRISYSNNDFDVDDEMIIKWPTSQPMKNKHPEIDNPMEIRSGDKTWTINWVYWQYAWEVVYSDVGTCII
jgi:hypothetical protein